MEASEYLTIKTQIEAQTARASTPSSYFAGVHGLSFATKKFTNAFGSLFKAFALNLCPTVVLAVRDGLEVENFTTEAGGATATDAWEIWQRNLMDLRAGEIHKSALRDGDAFLIVTRDAETDEVQFYPQAVENCTVVYSKEIPGKRLYGAKFWLVPSAEDPKKNKIRLTVYYADRSERWITEKPAETLPEGMASFVPYNAEGDPIVQHGFPGVPVFHFGNDTDLGKFGTSELKDVIPVQDALNKSVADMLVAMEFSAFRQRWASGLDVDLDGDGNPIPPFKSGVERIWVSDSPDTKFGDFDTTDLTQFLAVKNSFRLDVAMVSGTPLHYFMPLGGDFPSGEALKKAEKRFVKKVKNRQLAFGAVWAEAMAYALGLAGKGETRLFVDWKSAEEIDESEMLDNLRAKQDLGVPDEQLWVEAGYGEEDIARFSDMKAAAAEKTVDLFNRGELPPTNP